MSFVHCHSHLLPSLSQLDQIHQWRIQISGSHPTLKSLRGGASVSTRNVRTKACFSSTAIVGAAIPPAQSGDISVFLQMSAFLFFIYWIANFVVPDIISKYYGFDKPTTEEQNSINETPLGGDESSKTVSETKKRGFNSTKT